MVAHVLCVRVQVQTRCITTRFDDKFPHSAHVGLTGREALIMWRFRFMTTASSMRQSLILLVIRARDAGSADPPRVENPVASDDGC